MLRFVAGIVALALLIAVALWVELQPPPPLRSVPVELRIEDVTAIIPGVARWEHATLTIRDGVIARIELPAGRPPAEASGGAYAGGFVLPGLIDLHTHLPPGGLFQLTPYFSLLYLGSGVTSVRDVGDVDGTAVPAARGGMSTGRFPGPRIYACGPFVGGGPPRWPNSITLESAAEADAVVARLASSGFDCVKLYEDLTTEEIAALVAAGRKYEIHVLGHVPAGLAYEEAGVPEVQHFLGVPRPEALERDHVFDRIADWREVDDARLAQIVAATLEQGIVNTPTLTGIAGLLALEDPEAASQDPAVQRMPRMFREVIWSPLHGFPFLRGLGPADFALLRDTLNKGKRLLARLHRAGAQLQIGTDALNPFVVPGVSLHAEMRHFHEAGMTPEQVWAIATWKAARVLGEELLGTLQAGAPADLLVFREDPTRHLDAFETLEAVVADGRLYSRAAIATKLEAYREHFDGPVVDRLSVLLARWQVPRLALRDY